MIKQHSLSTVISTGVSRQVDVMENIDFSSIASLPRHADVRG
jgi:hypothetical protein